VEVSRARGLARTAERELASQEGEITRLRRKLGTIVARGSVADVQRSVLEGRVTAERQRLAAKEQEAVRLETDLAQSVGLAEQQQTRLEATTRRVAALEAQAKANAVATS